MSKVNIFGERLHSHKVNKMKNDKNGITTTMLAVIIVAAVIVIAGTAYMVLNPGEKIPTETLSISGSTTVLPVVAACAEKFMLENSGTEVMVSGGGSGVGVTAVGEGTAQIGMSSRELKSDEIAKYPNLVQHIIAKDGISIIVNKENPVTQLTIEQIMKIYAGNITDWADVGGTAGAIVVLGRDSNSGTRGTFDELVLKGAAPVATMEQLGSNGEVHDKVMSTPGAIGYVGLGYVDEEVKGLDVSKNGTAYIAPSVANVQAGTYPISRNLNMFTDGEATGLSKNFLDYMISPEGQAIVEQEGFVPIA
jgi:phosphate transport system substrate-binding protein